MESIGEVLDSVKTYLKERLTNPLYGAFVASWAIVNFRLLLVFTGGGTWQEKITYIDTRLFINWSDWFLNGYVYPFLAALTYMLLAPIVNRRVTVYLRQQDRVTIMRLLEIEGETPIPKPEAEQLRKGLLAERATRLSQQQESSEKLAELSRQIDLLSIENKNLKSSAGVTSGLPVGGVPLEAVPSTEEIVGKGDGDSDVDADVDVNQTYRLTDHDFVGVNQKTVDALVSRGLSHFLAEGLHSFSDGAKKHASHVQSQFGLSGHKVKVLIDQLEGLKLIDSTTEPNGLRFHTITSAGTQALDALMRRGFIPAGD